jgi:hypothetical protein
MENGPLTPWQCDKKITSTNSLLENNDISNIMRP